MLSLCFDLVGYSNFDYIKDLDHTKSKSTTEYKYSIRSSICILEK